MRRDFNRIDQTLGQAFWSYVCPLAAAVPRQINESVIAAGPNHAFLVRRFHDVSERAVVFRADFFVCVRPASSALFLFFVAREVR